nr:Hsp70 family protein [Kibdelosporangium sp. MJ126-NF4]CTQ90328.1 Chaperone protein DnaK [Kibdelosporangium sp. MJ126-NF4]
MGIDLGTSFTAAAVSGAGRTVMVPLSPEMIVSSVAYPAPDGSLLTGGAALAAANDPEKVARNFKRRLGDPTPLVLGGSAYSAAVLMAAQLREVLAETTRFTGAPPGSVTLTCPAIWGPYRREHFTEVLRLADVADYRLITEPEAAATHYSSERRLGDGEVVAVYDLGGGTFDTTILRMSGGEMEILGTPEGIEHMGGIDFDETLLADIDDKLDGAITDLDLTDPAAAKALVEIRAMCVRAKEDLSIEPDVQLTVPLPSGPREVVITRLELNDMIRPSIQLTADALRRTIASAGLRAEDLSAVLLAGGSSRIPLVSQLVSEEFGKPVRVTLHPKFTVSLGAAAMATREPVTSTAVEPTRTLATTSITGATPGSTATSSWDVTPPWTPTRRPQLPTTTRSTTEGATPSEPRRRWLMPGVAAAAIVMLAVVTTLFLTRTGGEAQQAAGSSPLAASSSIPSTVPSTTLPTTTAPTTTQPTTTTGMPDDGSPKSTAQPPPPPATEPTKPSGGAALKLFENGPVSPFTGFIADEGNWGGTELQSSAAAQASITAAADGQGVRVTWKGDAPAQMYLQTPRSPKDFSAYAGDGGALVFTTTMHKAPTGAASLQVHCSYPCKSQLNVTGLFKNLPPEKPTPVKIPLSCFTAAGLDPKKVDTPFLVYAVGELDATFANIRWEKNVKDATPCAQVK